MAELTWWLWLIIGVVLMIAELRFGTWYVFWLGVSACGVGVVSYLYPDASLGGRIFLWLVVAAALILTHSRVSSGAVTVADSPRRNWPNQRRAIRRRKR